MPQGGSSHRWGLFNIITKISHFLQRLGIALCVAGLGSAKCGQLWQIQGSELSPRGWSQGQKTKQDLGRVAIQQLA